MKSLNITIISFIVGAIIIACNSSKKEQKDSTITSELSSFSNKIDNDTLNSKESGQDNLVYQSEEIDENINDGTSDYIETQEICDIRNLKESKYHDVENELLNGKVRSVEWSNGKSNYVINFNTNGDYQSIVHYSDNPHAPTHLVSSIENIPSFVVSPGSIFNLSFNLSIIF